MRGPIIRTAAAGDVDAILDLLTHYDLPRAHFEPLYRDDPTYRPEHSWVVDDGGRLVAHLRVYERSLRLCGGVVRMGGIGNVVTDREARGRGFARLLLERVCEQLDVEHAVSLLWTHAPRLYAAHGWHPLPQHVVVAQMRRDADAAPLQTVPGSEDDIADSESLLERADSARSGTMPRSAPARLAQRAWLHEDQGGFRVIRGDHDRIRAYVRTRTGSPYDILEVGAMPGDNDAARALLCDVAGDARRIRVTLPPSLRGVVRDTEIIERPASQLMLRVCSAAALCHDLRVPLQERAGEGALTISLSAPRGGFQVSISSSSVSVSPMQEHGELDAAGTARLLLYGSGADGPALDDMAQRQALQRLFPPQDTVIWQSDRF